MADPLTLSAVGWGISTAGWIIAPIITRLLNKAFSLISSDESKKLRHLETNILPRLALILKAVERSEHRGRFEQLVKELKSAFDEVEDILDDVEYCRLEKQLTISSKKRKNASDDGAGPSNQDVGSRSSWTMTGNLKSHLTEMLKKIEKLIDEAQKIIELANLPSNNENGNHSPEVTANYVQKPTAADPPRKVTGRDEDRRQIISMLRDTENDDNPSSSGGKCFSVIGIHGIPGSGKTTLAQYVCEYEEKESYFDLVMWVHVSQNFRVDTIFSEMIEQATGKPCPQFKGLNALQKTLKEELRGKRFLLVLDDVWYNKDLSQEALSPLEVGEAGSRILVTSGTRDALLALGAVRSRCIPISDLGDNDFHELFMQYALDGAEMDDRDRGVFEMIGVDIAKKLKRSPLAARTVGGQLRIRQDVDFWRIVQDRDLFNDTMGALWWSYQHLDEQVKRCFAYCSIFPKGYPLRRDYLINLWVAEGFINEEEVEAVGGDYLHKLAATSFLQLVAKYQRGEEYYFVHDLLHGLAETVAGSDCFRIERGWARQVPQDVRHLFIKDLRGEVITDKIVKLKKLRTLIIDGKETSLEAKVFDAIFNSLGTLRVLSVETKHTALIVPESIDQLKHLRYLAVGDVSTIYLQDLSMLYHMRVLDFGGCQNLVRPKHENMSNLINLRQLVGPPSRGFPNIGWLRSLRTLPFFTVRKEQGYELRQLKHLNKLRGRLEIRGLENVGSKQEAIEAKLADKKGLTELVLVWGDKSFSANVQAEVLEGLCPPMELDRLEIKGYHGLRYPNWMAGEQNGRKYPHELRLSWSSPLALLAPLISVSPSNF